MIIKNGIVADPASGLYEQMDILVKDGKIVKIAPDISCASDAAATCNKPCVACQPAGLDVRLGLDVGGFAGGKLVVTDGQVDGRIRNIDLDGVTLLDEADGAAGGCLGADMADGRAAGRTGEAAIGDERHGGGQLHARQRTGGVLLDHRILQFFLTSGFL